MTEIPMNIALRGEAAWRHFGGSMQALPFAPCGHDAFVLVQTRRGVVSHRQTVSRLQASRA